MANITYCRIQNTYNDLVDVNMNTDFDNLDFLSVSELKHLVKLIKLCDEISFFTEDGTVNWIEETLKERKNV